MSKAEMDQIGWDSCDIVLVTGDAYVYHPGFGMAPYTLGWLFYTIVSCGDAKIMLKILQAQVRVKVQHNNL